MRFRRALAAAMRLDYEDLPNGNVMTLKVADSVLTRMWSIELVSLRIKLGSCSISLHAYVYHVLIYTATSFL